MKQRIRLTESELHNIIAECVQKILINEFGYITEDISMGNIELGRGVRALGKAVQQKLPDYWKDLKFNLAKRGIGTQKFIDNQGYIAGNQKQIKAGKGQFRQKGKMNGEKSPTFKQALINHYNNDGDDNGGVHPVYANNQRGKIAKGSKFQDYNDQWQPAEQENTPQAQPTTTQQSSQTSSYTPSYYTGGMDRNWRAKRGNYFGDGI